MTCTQSCSVLSVMCAYTTAAQESPQRASTVCQPNPRHTTPALRGYISHHLLRHPHWRRWVHFTPSTSAHEHADPHRHPHGYTHWTALRPIKWTHNSKYAAVHPLLKSRLSALRGPVRLVLCVLRDNTPSICDIWVLSVTDIYPFYLVLCRRVNECLCEHSCVLVCVGVRGHPQEC